VQGPVVWVSPSLEAGGYVEAGQSLLKVDPSDYQTALARAQASYQQALAETEFAEAELSRSRDLEEQGLASKSQLQNTQRTEAVAAARLVDAKASVTQAELDLERTDIKAPFNAVVNSKEVELGQFINRAQNVAVLYGADEVEVRVPLAFKQLGYLDVPLGLRGELDPDSAPEVLLTGMFGGEQQHWVGKLLRVEASIDAASNSVQSIIRVSQPTVDESGYKAAQRKVPLPIGLYVQSEISGRQVDDIISLPRTVIRNNNQVLVVDAENKMYFREVEIFRLEEDRVLISGGLIAGEKICISPIQSVYDGMSVQPVEEII
jgi:RND family efflux transporter MFP subunit